AYARQFLERMQKPLVDSIEGLSPAVAIEQRNPTRTSRSTVGTATEIYDYLRLLWARIGRTICPVCGRELHPDTPQHAADRVLELPAGTRLLVAFPLRLSGLVSHAVAVENLRAEGFVRVVADGVTFHVDDLGGKKPDLTKCKEVLVVADRLAADIAERTRLTDAIETAFREGDGDAVVIEVPAVDDATPRRRPPSAVHRPSPACDSRPGSSAPTTTRARRIRPRSCSASTTRVAPAPPAMVSAPRSNTTWPSWCRIRNARCARVRSTRGPSRGTRTSGAPWPRRPSARAFRWTARGATSPMRSTSSCCAEKPRDSSA
ncbi:MAG: hypothetical protein NTW72_04435, partial [Gemmatimonadetes bacterium]|nr:hypothetical protein [Gemmatimonadota bacterium]